MNSAADSFQSLDRPALTAGGFLPITRHAEALAQFEAMKPSRREPLAFTGMARTRALMEDTSAARRLLDELADIGRQIYVPAATIASVHVALGDNEAALDWLERMVEERAIMAMWARGEPHWHPLRSHERFERLLSRIVP